MSSQAIEKFRQYLENQNDDFLKDGRRVEGIIRDIFPEEKTLISLLITAWRAGVVTELRQSSDIDVTVAQFADRLSQECGLKESAALSAVRVWAYALGVTKDKTITEVQKAAIVSAEASAGKKSDIADVLLNLIARLRDQLARHRNITIVICAVIGAIIGFANNYAVEFATSTNWITFFVIWIGGSVAGGLVFDNATLSSLCAFICLVLGIIIAVFLGELITGGIGAAIGGGIGFVISRKK